MSNSNSNQKKTKPLTQSGYNPGTCDKSHHEVLGWLLSIVITGFLEYVLERLRETGMDIRWTLLGQIDDMPWGPHS